VNSRPHVWHAEVCTIVYTTSTEDAALRRMTDRRSDEEGVEATWTGEEPPLTVDGPSRSGWVTPPDDERTCRSCGSEEKVIRRAHKTGFGMVAFLDCGHFQNDDEY